MQIKRKILIVLLACILLSIVVKTPQNRIDPNLTIRMNNVEFEKTIKDYILEQNQKIENLNFPDKEEQELLSNITLLSNQFYNQNLYPLAILSLQESESWLYFGFFYPNETTFDYTKIVDETFKKTTRTYINYTDCWFCTKIYDLRAYEWGLFGWYSNNLAIDDLKYMVKCKPSDSSCSTYAVFQNVNPTNHDYISHLSDAIAKASTYLRASVIAEVRNFNGYYERDLDTFEKLIKEQIVVNVDKTKEKIASLNNKKYYQKNIDIAEKILNDINNTNYGLVGLYYSNKALFYLKAIEVDEESREKDKNELKYVLNEEIEDTLNYLKSQISNKTDFVFPSIFIFDAVYDKNSGKKRETYIHGIASIRQGKDFISDYAKILDKTGNLRTFDSQFLNTYDIECTSQFRCKIESIQKFFTQKENDTLKLDISNLNNKDCRFKVNNEDFTPPVYATPKFLKVNLKKDLNNEVTTICDMKIEPKSRIFFITVPNKFTSGFFYPYDTYDLPFDVSCKSCPVKVTLKIPEGFGLNPLSGVYWEEAKALKVSDFEKLNEAGTSYQLTERITPYSGKRISIVFDHGGVKMKIFFLLNLFSGIIIFVNVKRKSKKNKAPLIILGLISPSISLLKTMLGTGAPLISLFYLSPLIGGFMAYIWQTNFLSQYRFP